MRQRVIALLFSICLTGPGQAQEESLRISSNDFDPVLVPTADLGLLKNRQVQDIFLYRYTDDGWQAVPFQVDLKNSEGQYDFDQNEERVDDNDTLAFMPGDAGTQAVLNDAWLKRFPHVALAVEDSSHQATGWVYVLVDNTGTLSRNQKSYLRYDAVRDAITTGNFKITFSDDMPMLVDDLRWWNANTGHYGEDRLESMQLVHTGKFLHTFPFFRSHRDYASTVTGVITGPIRIIRRTENHVRIVWQLESPAVYIDYIVNAKSIYMDTVLDLPFSARWFFSDINTWSTLEWKHDRDIKLTHASLPEALPLNAISNAGKQAINRSQDTHMGITCDDGKLFFTIDTIDDMPIAMYAFINNENHPEDNPRSDSEYLSYTGFKTNHWEKLGKGQHHFILKAVLAKDINDDKAYAWLNGQ